MYRFRTIENLLGKYKELENQEIYFATPEQLNDPMEGYRDIFWTGDSIVWENLLINYIRCLQHTFLLAILLNDKKVITEEDIPIFFNSGSIDIIENNGMLIKIQDKFFNYKFIKNLPSILAKRNSAIRRNELQSYLSLIHPFAINAISEVFHQEKMIYQPLFQKDLSEIDRNLSRTGIITNLLNKLEKRNSEHKNFTEVLFSIAGNMKRQIDLINQYQNSLGKLSANKLLLLLEFPEKFLSKLETLIYPEWYSASFLFDCTNSAIWGHYGDNHKGVCLKFKTESLGEKIQMNLQTEYGYSNSGPIIGMRPHIFHKVLYHNKHTEIDFFRSLGRFPTIQLYHYWYKDKNGDLSKCGDHLTTNTEEWRNKYWENYYDSLKIKLVEWEYEQEYRLIISGDFIDYSSEEKRKLKYNFDDLEAIVFGIKTSTSDKIQIIKIIEEKCKKTNRKDFEFYQADYSKVTSKIENYKLDLLKLD